MNYIKSETLNSSVVMVAKEKGVEVQASIEGINGDGKK